MTKERITYLFQLYVNNLASADELSELEEVLQNEDLEMEIKSVLTETYSQVPFEQYQDLTRVDADRIFQAVVSPAGRTYRLWKRVAAAAAVLLVFGAAWFFLKGDGRSSLEAAALAGHIVPGKSSSATLTLANGRKIVLGEAATEVAREAGVVIVKTSDGQVSYSAVGASDSAGLNTLNTANGETYRVRLPDGTLVWLNAASSLTYPASFARRKERRVTLSGEAYFEVAKDKLHPFIVASGLQQVQVLGTHFNVNAYGDEPEIRTTLLEGSVRLNDEVVLKPGEQAAVSRSGKISVAAAEGTVAVAWKEGDFVFESEPIQTVMRKIARWYDVEVEYSDADHSRKYSGRISRTENVAEILELLEQTKTVKFEIRGRKIMVIRQR